MDNIIFKFTWPKPAGFEPLELIIAGNDLKARDPEGKSLIAGKLRNLGSKDSRPDSPIEFSTIGPLVKSERFTLYNHQSLFALLEHCNCDDERWQ
jgi:hypothetical protein